jgi:hypothetical protein
MRLTRGHPSTTFSINFSGKPGQPTPRWRQNQSRPLLQLPQSAATQSKGTGSLFLRRKVVSLALKQKNDYAAEHPDGHACNGFGGSSRSWQRRFRMRDIRAPAGWSAALRRYRRGRATEMALHALRTRCAQCLSGDTPTCGHCANPVFRAWSSKPLLRQKKAPGMVVGITST